MKSVVVCSSKKYKTHVRRFCRALEGLGVVVYEPNFSAAVPEDAFFQSKQITKTIFKGLTQEHFDWIRKADVCYVFNRDKYVGVSVSMEMGFAAALGKPIYSLMEQTGDPSRDAIIDKVVKTPKALITLL